MTQPTKAEPQPSQDNSQETEALGHWTDRLGIKKVLRVLERVEQENSLKPFQAELILMQKYLEDTKRRMIIVFEGRDASGKGGTIRRVSRYMNEKHYRVVALGKPTDAQRTQWFFQRYVEQFPRGGEVVLFDRA
jgi:polyphosphate kinase 2 (PPK2 family)